MNLSDGTKNAVTGSFHTADTPRILSIDGLRNVRDIGGWAAEDGGELRQGMLFRGSEASSVSARSEERASSMELLGIRTELDLRAPGEGSSAEVFDEGVRHISCPAGALEDAFSEAGMDRLRAVFTELAITENYPVYLHCTDGGLRTGTVCCLVEALAGMEREDILREYALTDPYNAEALESEAAALLDGLDGFDGDTLSERTRSFLIACGVTAKELDAICGILKEA